MTEAYQPIRWLPIWIRRRPPEDSIPLRLLTLTCVMTAVVAVLREMGWPSMTVPVLLSTPLGYLASWLRRRKNNWWIKFIIFWLMLLALGVFFRNLFVNPYDPRFPLAELLLWLQMLHSYDLPAKRDMDYSMLVSFILISVAAVFSADLVFILFFLPFVFLSIPTLIYSHYLEMKNLTAQSIQARFSPFPGSTFSMIARASLLVAVLSLLGGLLIYLLLPRFPGMRIQTLPVSMRLHFALFGDGRMLSPGYAFTGGGILEWRRKKRIWGDFNPESYFGFAPYLDLNYRGALSDRVVMKVKSMEPGFWRGMVFDMYTGQGWVVNRQGAATLTASTPPFYLTPETSFSKELYSTKIREVVQIYHVEEQLPNLIFSLSEASRIYFPAETLFQDPLLNLRAPFLLEPGMIYSVISLVPHLTVKDLRAAPTSYPVEISRRYLQLPDTLPKRVRDLALRIARPYKNPHDKVWALMRYLEEYPYDLRIPPPPGDQDAVDHFLFDLRRGYCEQFSSALAVMARINGIPSRLVTGFATGTYNPFTFFYEVKGSDAHAWTEIYFPTYGWVPTDPSPGFSATPAPETPEGNWMIPLTLKWIGTKIRELIPQQMRWILALPSLTLQAFSLSRSTYSRLSFLLTLTILFSVALLLLALRRRRKEKPLSFHGSLKQKIISLYLKGCQSLTRKGYRKLPSQTPSEFLALVSPTLSGIHFSPLTEIFLRARYSHHPLTQEDLRQAEDLVRKLVGSRREIPHQITTTLP